MQIRAGFRDGKSDAGRLATKRERDSLVLHAPRQRHICEDIGPATTIARKFVLKSTLLLLKYEGPGRFDDDIVTSRYDISRATA